MKFISRTAVFLFVFYFCFLAPISAGEIVNKIIAVVDDKVITQSDYQEALAQYPREKNQKRIEALGLQKVVLEDLINQSLLEIEIENKKIEVGDDQVELALQDAIRSRGTTLDALQKDLEKKGIGLESFKNKLKFNLERQQFLQKFVYTRINVAEYDVQEYYRLHQNEFKGFDEIRFLEIFITPQGIPAGKNAYEFADDLASQIRQGANFGALAKKYSGGAFAKQGGDSGLLKTSMMRPDLLNLLLMLPENTVSDPLPSPGSGFFVFKVLEKRGIKTRPLNEVKEMIQNRLGEEKVYEELDRYLVEARARHFIEIRQ